MMPDFITISNLADILGTSIATVQKWGDTGVYPMRKDGKGRCGFYMEDLRKFESIREMIETNWDEEAHVVPLRDFTSVELFAGAGGLALGMHLAGFKHVLLNEMDAMACQTLRHNHPEWNVLEGDVHNVDFTPLRGHVDFLSGGFPCQSFSYAGKKEGLDDARGTLFFELARAVREIQPKVFLGENVKGLLSHDDGKTLQVIRNVISELGYTLIEPRVLKAIMYQVPQKRERLILIAIRNDIAQHVKFRWPSPYKRVMTLRDAFFAGELFSADVPQSDGVVYPEKKKAVMEMVPEGGDWRDLPVEVQKAYMGGSFHLGGGKTGMARRLSLDEPSLTLTCAPAQKQTERCHPTETRPLTVREYARIQTFPDEWQFKGNMSAQYKQIGNAVPVNLSYAIGRSLIRLFNEIDAMNPEGDIYTDACNIARRMLPPDLYELDLFGVKQQYPTEIIVNPCIDKKLDAEEVDLSKNVLICLVKSDNIGAFNNRSAKLYYTGKKFPSTVRLNELYYFMPYTKRKGIRDLYYIKVARVGTKHEARPDSDDDSLRIVFEIEFVKQIFEDYQPVKLKIWETFTDTTLEELTTES